MIEQFGKRSQNSSQPKIQRRPAKNRPPLGEVTPLPKPRKPRSRRPPRPAVAPQPKKSSESRLGRSPAPQRRSPAPGGMAPRPRPATVPSRRPVNRKVTPLLYGTRLLILGLGLGAIAGTLLSAWDPSTRQMANLSPTASPAIHQSSLAGSPAPAVTPMPLKDELAPLKAKIQALVQKNPKLQPGVFLQDLESGSYVDWQGTTSFAAASTIKVPVLVAFFQDVDAGKIRLDEMLTMKEEHKADGSGDMQYRKVGTRYSALEVATKMIIISDNTATNMLIERLGGAAALNQRFRSWGLTTTTINNVLPDIEGTNVTTAKELSQLMVMVGEGKLVSMISRDRMLDIMERTVTNTLLPQGLGKGARIAHKTGNIGALVGDVGLVDMPSGKRYAVTVLVKRPRNDPQAQEMIRQISRTIYQHLNATNATSTPPALTSTPPATVPQLTADRLSR